MLKNKNRILIFAMVVLLALSLIGSASWMIIRQVSGNAINGEAKQNDYFTSSVEYNGEQQFPLPTDGNPYGFSYTLDPEDIDDNSKLVTDKFTVEWLEGYDPAGTKKNSWLTFNSMAPGTHYYKITDNTTGQVIAERHKMTITVPMSLVSGTTPTTDRTVYYEGEQPIYTAQITTNGRGGDHTFSVTLTGEPLVFANGVSSTASTSTVSTVNVVEVSCTDTSYNSEIYTYDVIKNVSLTVRSVAYTAGGHEAKTGTYYGTIEKAIAAANSGTNKYVYVSEIYSNYTANVAKNGTVDEYKQIPALTVKGNATINKGVTLVLPCATVSSTVTKDDEMSETTDYDYVKTLIFGTDKRVDAYWSTMKSLTTYLYSNISIGEGASLTNNGTVLIGGVVSGGNGGAALSGFTSGAYGQITLYNKAEFTNNSTVECYGFIDDESEDTKDTRAKMFSSSTSKLISPFTVEEHRGGSNFLDMAGGIGHYLGGAVGSLVGGSVIETELLCAAFNRYYMSNVVVTNHYTYGAQLCGFADLYANNDHNVTIVTIIGASTTSLIRLMNSNTTMSTRYDPESRITDLDIYGNASLNPLVLNLDVSYSGMDVKTKISTAKIFFSINWHFNVTLHKYETTNKKATVIFNQDVKILPGASVVVEDGVTLQASSIAVYKEYVEEDDPANSINPANGYWTDNKALGAATLYNQYYSTASEITTLDISAGKLIVNGTLNCNALAGDVHTTQSGSVILVSTSSQITSYEVGSTASLEPSDYQAINLTLGLRKSDGSTITATGAYISNGNTYTLDDTTYNCWEAVGDKTFNITYYSAMIDGQDVTTSELTGHSFKTKFTYEDPVINLTEYTPTAPNGYKFVGWFKDETCITQIDKFVPKENVGDASLYACFISENTPTYTITFNQNLPEGAVVPKEVAEKLTSSWETSKAFIYSTLETFDPYSYEMNDVMSEFRQQIDVSVYFNYWYFEDGTEFSTDYLMNLAKAKAEAEAEQTNITITLYAKWSNKSTFTVQNAATGEKPQEIGNYLISEKGTYTFYVIEGDTISVTITANHNDTKSGWRPTITVFVYISVDGEQFTGSADATGSLLTVSATAEKTCTVSVKAGTTIVISGDKQ